MRINRENVGKTIQRQNPNLLEIKRLGFFYVPEAELKQKNSISLYFSIFAGYQILTFK